jgi:hypothetical protein
MPILQTILERKKEVSGQVSTQTRTLALGFLGISWALLTAHDEPLHTMAAHVSRLLILVLAATSVLVIAGDLLQYVAATSVAQDAIDRAEKVTPPAAPYDNTSRAYKTQAILYHLKFWLLSLGALLLLFIFIGLFSAPPAQPSPTTCPPPATTNP